MVLDWLPLVLAMSGQAAPPPQTAPPTTPQNVRPAVTAAAGQSRAPRRMYDEAADARAQIAAAIASAEEDDIRVLINWGANDDERCATFAAVRRAPEIATPRLLSNEYKVVYVDVGRADRNMDVAAAYGAAPSAGALPHLTVLDETGKPLAQAAAAELVGEAPSALDPKKIAAFLTRHQAPAPDAEPPFKAALSQAKKDGRYVFLWFSAPW